MLRVGSFLLTTVTFLLTVDNFSFLLRIGAFLLTALAFVLAIGAFLFTVGKWI